MALQYNPKLVTDGLVLHIDPSLNKCFPTFDLPVKSGLILWLDAADDSTFSYSDYTASLVSQWRDKSGLNNHASTSTNKPRRNSQLFSRPSLNFSSSNAVSMSIQSGISLPGDASIFIVHKPGVQDNQYAILIDNFHGTGGTYGFVIQRISTNSEFYYSSANGSIFLDTSSSPWTYTNNTPQILSLNKNSSTGTPYNNGTSLTNRTLHATISQYTTALSIGSWGGYGGRFYNGDMCEILIFNRSLSSNEMKQVHTYLGQKWGIANTDKSVVELTERANAATLTPDARMNQNFQKSIQFNNNQGSGSYLTFGNLNLNLSSFTVDYWFKLTSDPNVDGNNTYRLMMVKDSSFYNYMEEAKCINFTVIKGGTEYRRIGNYNGNQGVFGNGLVEGADFTSTFSLDTWYNTTFIYNASNGYGYYYLNGSLINSGPMRQVSSPYTAITPGNVDNSTSHTYFSTGYSGGLPYFFTGRLASLKVYNKALSALEVSQNYQAVKDKFTNDIVEYGLVLNLDISNPYTYGGTGSIIYDTSPTALYWTGSNVTYNSDPIKIFSYNGSNSWLQSSTSTVFDTQTLTMECWCLPSSLAQNGFLFEKGQVNTQYSMFFSVDPLFVFRTINLSTQDLVFTPSSYLSTSRWNHIVCTYGAGTKTIYVNGVQIVQQTGLTGTIPTGQTNQYIGKYGNAGNNFPFNGKIAVSRVYNRSLSASEVLKNYNSTKAIFGL
jgi:hypothetical protein